MFIKKGVLLVLGMLFIISLFVNISALGVGPAKIEVNFQPSLEKTIGYQVMGSSYNELEIYTKGDLAQYVKLSQTIIKTGDGFTATLKFPDKIEEPGDHYLYIGVKEIIDPELVYGNIGTAVAIEVLILVHVPYPGRYVGVDLKATNANVGEPVDFEINLLSKGTEDVSITPKIEIFSKDEKKEELIFKERILPSQGILDLKKSLDTTKYNPGIYNAVAVVDYGIAVARDEAEFKIGSLNIDILGFTSKIPLNKLQKFDVDVQSGWNDNIDGVYGEVSFFNGSSVLQSFKTTTTNLIPWENKTITGYVDTSGFLKGFYDVNITLFYFGKDRGSTTSKMVKVEFIEGKSILAWYILGGAGLLIIIVLLGIKFLHKKRRRK